MKLWSGSLCALLVLLLAGLGDPALAKSKKKKKKKRKAKTEQVEQGEGDEAPAGGQSAAARGAKPFGAGLLITPLSDFVLQAGVGGHYNLGADLQVGLHFLQGSEDLAGDFADEGTVTVTTATLSGQAFWVYGRYFFGNSFNMLGGLGMRSASAEFEITDKSTNEYLRNNLEISTVILPIAIGNHWSWDSGFTLGVDWVAYLVAISGGATSTTETNIAGGEDAADAEVKKLNDDIQALGDDLANSGSLTLFLTTIGWQF